MSKLSTAVITHPKIASMEPRWNPFAGWSLLYAPIGIPTGGAGSDHPISRIADAFNEELREFFRQNYLLCSLPASTYHITFCDIVNVGSIPLVVPEQQSYWTDAIRDPLTVPQRLLEVLDRAGATPQMDAAQVEFEFDGVHIRKGTHLVVALKVREAPHFAELNDIRKKIDASLPMIEDQSHRRHRPHITLGYFANPEAGQSARTQLAALNEKLRAAMADRILTFEAVRLFAFFDMATYQAV